MTLFRYKKNGLLYTIITNGRGSGHKAIPYKHGIEIGVLFSSHSRYRDFKSTMSMDDFIVVAEQ